MMVHAKRSIPIPAATAVVFSLIILLTAATCSRSAIKTDAEGLTDILYFEDDFSAGMDNWDVAGGTAEVESADGKSVLRFTSDDITSGIVLRLKEEIWETIASRSSEKSPGNLYVEMGIVLTGDSRGNKNIGIASDISPDGTAFYYGGINYNNRLQMGYLPGDGKGYQNTSGIPMVKSDSVAYRTDGYKLRYEISKDGSKDEIMLYMNDIPIGKNNMPVAYTVPGAGRAPDGSGIGVYSCAASFVLEYVKVGPLDGGKTALLVSTADPDFVQLSGSIPYRETAKILRAGESPVEFTVTARRFDGSDDSYTVTASGDSVRLSSEKGKSGTAFSVAPVKPGESEVIIANRSNPGSSRKIVFTVEEGLTFVRDSYSGLSERL
ncbi:MAG: hypothetical protein LBR47_04810, partial [Spirochaetaceae bacterium]|nr:hypothetical protein [Spirochaetaceae bacterium]